MRTTCILLLLCTGLAACSSLTSAPPPVADSTMVQVLAELHLLRARLRTPGLPPTDTSRSTVLSKYQLSTEQFDEALAYYTEHPEAFEVVYDQVLDQLSQERSQPATTRSPSAPESGQARSYAPGEQ